MRHSTFALCLLAAIPSVSPAAVVVLANYTREPITLTIAEPGGRPREVKLAAGQVAPIPVQGPADVQYPARPAEARARVEAYHAYVLIPDEKAGRRLEGVELPGKPPERDARPEADPPPAEPVKIPVRLYVDDADPRAEKFWQEALKKRFDAAAPVIEAHAGVRLTLAGFGTWASDPEAKAFPELLAGFEKAVKAKPGELAVGYTSRKAAPGGTDFADTRGLPARHVLLREWRPRSEPDKVDVLVHQLGLALGAVPLPDPGSVMRPKPGDGLANHRDYRYRFDPLNALAMSLWAEEFRRGPVGELADASPAGRARLGRVYGAIAQANPGEARALAFVQGLDRPEVAQAPPGPPPPKADRGGRPRAMPKEPAPLPKAPEPAAPSPGRRDAVASAVVGAVVERARADGAKLAGDELTPAYVQVAARAALAADATPEDRAAGFLVGLAVALDSGETLRADPLTSDAARAAEPDAARGERLAVLGNPSLRGRRDLCRRFAVGLGRGGLADPDQAVEVAVSRSVAPGRPGGVSLPGLAAELAGVRLASAVRANPDAAVRALRDGFDPRGVLPDLDGLRDGLSDERFREDFGDAADDRFREALNDIVGRLNKLPAVGGG